eukprot:m.11226 g.11226  ORF g.11226 m.11226 type:complete len:219 (-) comp5544_c0_seq1:136-792(-)
MCDYKMETQNPWWMLVRNFGSSLVIDFLKNDKRRVELPMEEGFVVSSYDSDTSTTGYVLLEKDKKHILVHVSFCFIVVYKFRSNRHISVKPNEGRLYLDPGVSESLQLNSDETIHYHTHDRQDLAISAHLRRLPVMVEADGTYVVTAPCNGPFDSHITKYTKINNPVGAAVTVSVSMDKLHFTSDDASKYDSRSTVAWCVHKFKFMKDVCPDVCDLCD